MDAQAILRLSELVLSNPFEESAERSAAEGELARLGASSIEMLATLANAGAVRIARRAALAFAYCDLAASRELSGRRLRESNAGIARLKLAPETVARTARSALACTATLASLAGRSKAMHRVRADAWRACFGASLYDSIRMRPLIRDQNVLLLGETGTGKEVLARAIAAAEGCAEASSLNAAAIPAELLESEMFGHHKGAFTNAHADRVGRIAAASGGTLFLDEIADLPTDLQVKLLRAIEENRVTPVGSNSAIEVDLRYISATSQPLTELVERAAFRRDLYERLAGVTIHIPPLRERREDLRPIAKQLFRTYADRIGQTSAAVHQTSTGHLSELTLIEARLYAWLESAEARERPWHGNVRELESVIRSWVLGFDPDTAARSAATRAIEDDGSAELARFIDGRAPLSELEDWYILHVLARADYKQRPAARILGIDRGTLARRLKRIGDPGSS